MQVLIKKTLKPEKSDVYRRFQQSDEMGRRVPQAARPHQRRRAEAGDRGDRVRRRRHRPVPHRAHVLRPHRRDARNDPGRHARPTARRRWPSCCRSSGTTSTACSGRWQGKPVTIRLARSAAARVPAARRQPSRTNWRKVCVPSAETIARRVERTCTNSTRCSAIAAAGSASSIPRSRRCRRGPSSRRPAIVKKEGIEVDPEVMIPLVGFRQRVAGPGADRPRRRPTKVFAEKGVEGRIPGRHDDRSCRGPASWPTRSPRTPSSSASAPTT